MVRALQNFLFNANPVYFAPYELHEETNARFGKYEPKPFQLKYNKAAPKMPQFEQNRSATWF